jgi:hypothetical protein
MRHSAYRRHVVAIRAQQLVSWKALHGTQSMQLGNVLFNFPALHKHAELC